MPYGPLRGIHKLIEFLYLLHYLALPLIKCVDYPMKFVCDKEFDTQRWTPSPFLSNVVLNGWDKELERRGHRFVRYGDDCIIYVTSHRAGERVMANLRVSLPVG